MAVGIRCADHATPLLAKVGTNIACHGGRSVGIVRLQTNNHGVCLHFIFTAEIILLPMFNKYNHIYKTT
jgi:hypothetical protein